MRTLTLTLLAIAGAAFCQTPPAKNDYSKPETWLCRPGSPGACDVDLSTTIVQASGSMKRETWKANPAAAIDCFYVYPTVSNDPTPNSDMSAGPEELSVIKSQFARFGSECRTFAPLYRQVTLTALRAGMAGKPMAADRTLGYNDVLDAWNYYLANDNKNRGVVLIGHSQGSGVLTQLVRNEVDGKPIQSRIISILLLGTNLVVPKGKDIGGAFKNIPLCKSASQIGCAIAYASFRSNVPPPSNSLFGRVQGEGNAAACTNPASLAGGSGALHAYLSAGGRGNGSAAEPKPWVSSDKTTSDKPSKPVDTPFVSVPGLLTAECVSDEHGSYLSVTVHGDPKDPRVDDISGDVVTNGVVQANWGLHLIDVSLAMGNLLDIVGKQAKAYLKKGM